MKYENLIFDLDGTISDPKDGIVRSLNYALVNHGFASQDESQLITYIGPPLDSAFKAITKSDNAALISSLVDSYRERYADVGFSENILYDGIPKVLGQLSAVSGITLSICTSKRVDFAERILDMFDLRHLFSFVNGGDVGIEKWQQLQSLKQQGDISHKSLMIGDRYIDLTAAHKNGLPSAGVLWGYGSLDELKEHEPAHIFSNPSELLSLVA